MVARVLGRAREHLALVVLEHATVRLADDALLDVRRRTRLSEERNLEEHGARQVDAFEQLEVDVHVERQLTLPLEAFLFGRDLGVALDHDALGEELLLSAAAADLLQRHLCVVHKTGTEGAEADLDQRSVEQDLRVDVEVVDGLLQVRHEHHVAGSVILVVEREVVYVTQHGSRPDEVLAVLVEIGAERADQVGALDRVSRRNRRVERGRNRFPGVLLEDGDHLSRLHDMGSATG